MARGRHASAAAPQWGYTCLLCPGQPSVITGGGPGDEDAGGRARDEFATHVVTTHLADGVPPGRIGEISLRAHAGPTAVPAAA